MTKIAIVTGASRGFGRGTARILASEADCLAPYICPLIFGFSNKVSGTGGLMSNA